MPSSLIALGANLGDRQRTLNVAIERLAALGRPNPSAKADGTRRRPSADQPGQGPFLNAAVRLETTASAEQLHQALRTIESTWDDDASSAGKPARSTSTCCCMPSG